MSPRVDSSTSCCGVWTSRHLGDSVQTPTGQVGPHGLALSKLGAVLSADSLAAIGRGAA